MRKITVIFLALAMIMAVAVACGKKEPATTEPPVVINTQYIPTTEPTTQPTTDIPSYVLTTQSDKTVPWAVTTRFEITQSTAPPTMPTQSAYASDYNVSFNVSEIPKPDVNLSQAPTYSTSSVDFPSVTEPTTKAEEDTTDKKAEPVSLIVNSYAYGDGVIYVEIDPSNWEGELAAASQNISVEINGKKLPTSGTCTVPSKKTGGIYEIKITVPEQSVESGDMISFTIPAGIVKNQSGSQYNLSYSSSLTV